MKEMQKHWIETVEGTRIHSLAKKTQVFIVGEEHRQVLISGRLWGQGCAGHGCGM
jgi:hypothetical protein